MGLGLSRLLHPSRKSTFNVNRCFVDGISYFVHSDMIRKQAAWIMMPRTETHNKLRESHMTETVDQHGRTGDATRYVDRPGTENDEKPENNPGIKDEGGEQYEEGDKGGKGDEDENGDAPSKEDITASLNRAAVGLIYLFRGMSEV